MTKEYLIKMRSMPHSRAICLFLMISMLLLGIHIGNADMDSSFVYGNSHSDSVSMLVRAMGIQKMGGEQPVSVFCERKLAEQSGDIFLERQSVRTAAGVRAGQWLMYLLLVMFVVLSSAFVNISFLQSDACKNQCRCRILEYIHHKDGKKV